MGPSINLPRSPSTARSSHTSMSSSRTTSSDGSSFATTFGPPGEVHPVLIAGAGPAGTLLAFCLAKLGICPLIVDSNHFIDHEWGRGDALLCRATEILRSLGIAERIISQGQRLYQRTFWDMTADPPTWKTISDYFEKELDSEELYTITIRQGLVEKTLTDATTSICGATVARPWAFVDAHIDETSPNSEPVVVTLKSQYGELREVRARYVVGCDGGRSMVRRSLEKYGVKFQGDAHDSVWCAMDVLGFKTDFPDVKKVPILSAKDGAILIIPREDIHGQNCFRFYCEMSATGATPSMENVVAKVHRVLQPYTITWDEVNWFTVYTVGQRIASAFDVHQRIFLAGDAAHLHSPKGALGMNTSLMDAHNLATKIALVHSGFAHPKILSTYALERRGVAVRLLEMDVELIELYAKQGGTSESPEHMQKLVAYIRKHLAFQAGTDITYAANDLVRNAVPKSRSAMLELVGGEGLIVGRRLLPAGVRRYSDGRPCNILDAAPYDGRFTVFICLGDLTSPGGVEQLNGLRDLVYRQGGILDNLGDRAEKVIRFAGVSTTSHLSIEFANLVQRVLDLPTISAVLPTKKRATLFDTTRLYNDDIPCLSPYVDHTAQTPSTAETDIISLKAAAGILLHPAHQKWDVDLVSGGIVVVRPDGHVGIMSSGLDGASWDVVEGYFKGFLVL
ncbi:FAD binding domain-containing protein [Roridomyces roridus]|uniref:FAD binding domain-containing protein n=1 Tax=Roridomyces roridus TaxID=1738132 RepID=A0AAD7FS13_9AGAR|nr:FAD binding domain-containing protein [Roridomyces roridus]